MGSVVSPEHCEVNYDGEPMQTLVENRVTLRVRDILGEDFAV